MAMNLEEYLEEVEHDVREYLEDNFAEDAKRNGWNKETDRDDIIQELDDMLWTNDGVTGNGSGSYTFNFKQAADNLADLIWSDELLELYKEMGYDRIPMEEGAEAVDVTIRCYYLNEAINNVVDEFIEALPEPEGEEVEL